MARAARIATWPLMSRDVTFSNASGLTAGPSKRAGVDSVVFSGAGWWNGKPGYRFEITACDRGEPGAATTRFADGVRAERSGGGSRDGVLRDGNIQAMK